MGKERVDYQENLAQIYVPRQTRTSTFISLLSDWERRVSGEILARKIYLVGPPSKIDRADVRYFTLAGSGYAECQRSQSRQRPPPRHYRRRRCARESAATRALAWSLKGGRFFPRPIIAAFTETSDHRVAGSSPAGCKYDTINNLLIISDLKVCSIFACFCL
jgi:hypothetical protein